LGGCNPLAVLYYSPHLCYTNIHKIGNYYLTLRDFSFRGEYDVKQD